MKEISALTVAQRKLIASLRDARHRRREQLFTLEGTRAVTDTLGAFEPVLVVATPLWLEQHPDALPCSLPLAKASAQDMQRISALQTPQGVLAVCRIPQADPSPIVPEPDELLLALDCIQDPGNLGTIVRLADWFGVHRIVASADTADLYNPKVVQATMGSLARVHITYVADLPAELRRLASLTPVYGTLLGGSDIYAAPLTPGGVVVMGNEGNGISAPVQAALTAALRIPSYPPDAPTVESLNVATATAITLAEFRRRITPLTTNR